MVEGKNDISWILKVLKILNKLDNYIVLPSGGADNIKHLKKYLNENGKICYEILDGDQDLPNSLSKEIIEQYIPVEELNKLFNIKLDSIPTNKKDFFASLESKKYSEDKIKTKIALWAYENLEEDNILVNEIKNILSKQSK